VKWQAAFMGWSPASPRFRLGPKFAHAIKPGNSILIARRFHGKPETVGFASCCGGILNNVLTSATPLRSVLR
jgi:hypothetical protein